jgi:hypothetical protein
MMNFNWFQKWSWPKIAFWIIAGIASGAIVVFIFCSVWVAFFKLFGWW